MYPRRIAEVKDADREGQKRARRSADARMARRRPRGTTVPDEVLRRCCSKPEWRDPRGYILPAEQGDFLTATKFVNIMIKSGLTVHRATAPFTVGGKSYPAGS